MMHLNLQLVTLFVVSEETLYYIEVLPSYAAQIWVYAPS